MNESWLKFLLCLFVFVSSGCAHQSVALKAVALKAESIREPAQAKVQQQAIAFLCLHGTAAGKELFQVAASGDVKYEIQTKDLPMVGRGPISSAWISNNVIVLSGRWESDSVCGPPSSCEYRYFSISLHKNGSGIEVTTAYRHPERIWKAEGVPVSCQVSQ